MALSGRCTKVRFTGDRVRTHVSAEQVSAVVSGQSDRVRTVSRMALNYENEKVLGFATIAVGHGLRLVLGKVGADKPPAERAAFSEQMRALLISNAKGSFGEVGVSIDDEAKGASCG